MEPGDIYRHDQFYRNPDTGELERKYLVFLARTQSDDWIARLLTSRVNARQEKPVCYLGHPYPGFFLGVPGSPLTLKTWVDLRWLGDMDPIAVSRLVRVGVMAQVSRLAHDVLTPLLKCAAAADDTTRAQERALRDQLTVMR